MGIGDKQMNNNFPLNNGIVDINNNINESNENKINNVNIKITDSNIFQNNFNSNINDKSK